MLKKFNVFALALLILGQTILGPIGTSVAFAEEQDESDDVFTPSEADTSDASSTEEVSVNKDALKTLLDEVTNYAADDYEEASAAYLQTLEEGKVVFNNADATQEDVNDAADKIKEAITALQQKTSTEGDDDEPAQEEPVQEVDKQGETPTNSEEIAPATVKIASEEGEGGNRPTYEDIVLTDDDGIEEVAFKVNGDAVNGVEVDVENGDTASFNITFKEISNQPPTYDVGTKLKYKLPENFTDVFEGITVPSIYGPAANPVGTIKIGEGADEGYLVITLADGILDSEGQVQSINQGNFNIGATFSSANTDWNKNIVIPGGDSIKLNFQPNPNEGVTIEKISKTTSDQKNINQIDWEVTVNTDLSNRTEDMLFSDVLEAIGEDDSSSVGHKFKKDSFMLYEIPVTPAGVGTPETTGTPITPTFTENDTVAEYTLSAVDGKAKAYKITYSTIPDNPLANEWIDYKNTAKYGNTPTGEKTVRVNYGKAIEKIGTTPGTDLVAKWRINYNFNNQTIAKDTTLTDEWITTGGDEVAGETGYQKMDNFQVVTESGQSFTDYTSDYTDGDDGFTLTFTETVTEPLIITYETKPVNYVATSSFDVKNTATRPDIEKSDPATVEYDQTKLTLVKEKGASIPNYHDKTMDWKITANQAGYPLAATTQFVDTFENTNMTLKPETLEVKIGNDVYTEATLEADKKYTLGTPTNGGFTITLKEPTTETIVITYTTDYEIKSDGQNTNQYPNKVQLVASDLPGNPESEVSYDIDNKQTDNGEKTGEYNYENKEFNWTVEFNFNYNQLTNAVFTDELDDTNQEITEIKVLRGIVKANGTFDEESATLVTDIGEADAIGTNKITLNLESPTSDAYKVIYTTKLKDGIFPETPGNYKVKNSAVLTEDDVVKFKKEPTVEVKYTENVLENKNGEQIPNTMGIKWNFEFNYAQSKLENVIITDTFSTFSVDDESPNQLIVPETFKVYTIDFNGTSEATNNKTEVPRDQYDLNLDTPGKFVLDLGNVDKAYYIEYETTFIGITDATVSNDVELIYSYSDNEQKIGGDSYVFPTFNYGSDVSTRAATFVIEKTNEVTELAIPNVEFTLLNSQDRVLRTGTTNNEGKLDFGLNLAEGIYKLVETDVEGYESLYTSENPYTFKLEYNEDTPNGQIERIKNTPTPGDVVITKQDIDRPDLKLSGAEFEIYHDRGNGVEDANKVENLIVDGADVGNSVRTGPGGTIKVILPPGKYIAVEVEAPTGYELSEDNSKEFEIIFNPDPDDPATVPFGNKIIPGSVIFEKVDSRTGEGLPGAEFDIVDENNIVVHSFVTETAGKYTLPEDEKLRPGTYKLVETKAPAGYQEITTEPSFVVPHNPQAVVEVDPVTNTAIPVEVTIEKVDDNTGAKLAGAEFTLTGPNPDNTENQDIIVDADGNVNGAPLSLPPGDYTLVETKAPNGYILPVDVADRTTDFTIEVATEVELESHVETVKNTALPRDLIITKVDSRTKAVLADAEFDLLDSNGDAVNTEPIVTNEDGKATIEELAPGEYSLVETKAPRGYNRIRQPIPVIIKNVNESNTDELIDLKFDGKFIMELEVENTRTPSGGGTPPPTDPEEPGDPTDPENPDPEEPGDPTDPEDPDPEEPGEPTDPENPDPEEPGEPTDPENPDPEEPGEPTDPENPDPEEPGKPTDPDNPYPEEPGKPTNPDNPDGDANPPAGDGNGTGGNGGNNNGNASPPGGTNGNKSDSGSKTDKLPQTGEEHYMYMIALGTLLLAAGASVLYRQRRKA